MPSPLRILVADDERNVREGLQGQLDSLGYDVVAAVQDGQHAVDLARRMLPDLVLLDVEMPVLDGLSAARQISRDPGVPVLILTAHGHPNYIEQAVENGVVHYLLKPVTRESLYAAIQVAMARSQEIKSLRQSVQILEGNLRDRKVVERAKGILMNRKNMSEQDAFRYLQRQSQDRRVSMAHLAESIVQADELLDMP